MMFALLCACQIAAAQPAVTVYNNGVPSRVEVLQQRSERLVRVADLKAALGAQFRPLPSGRAVLEISGVLFELANGVPYARVGDKIVPLASAPRLHGDTAKVPFQLLVEVLPRYVGEAKYEPRGRALAMDGKFPAQAVTTPPASASKPASDKSAASSAATSNAATGRSVASNTATSKAAPGKSAIGNGATSNSQKATATTVTASTATAASKPRTRKRTIVVDAGHGGPDVGTSAKSGNGKMLFEKDITLAVAQLLSKGLKSRGFDVVMTRSADTLIALNDRGALANRSSGDAFLSIHVNAAGSASSNGPRGVETYFLSAASSEDARRVQALENSSVRFEGSAAPRAAADPLAYILSDMKQNDHLRESSEFANQIQRSLAAIHPGTNRGVKQAEFAVLVGSFMPSALVEIGFLSNSSEAAYLLKADNQRKIAQSLAGAVASYFAAYDKRVIADGGSR